MQDDLGSGGQYLFIEMTPALTMLSRLVLNSWVQVNLLSPPLRSWDCGCGPSQMAWRAILDSDSREGFGSEVMETQVGSLGFTGDYFYKGEVGVAGFDWFRAQGFVRGK